MGTSAPVTIHCLPARKLSDDPKFSPFFVKQKKKSTNRGARRVIRQFLPFSFDTAFFFGAMLKFQNRSEENGDLLLIRPTSWRLIFFLRQSCNHFEKRAEKKTTEGIRSDESLNAYRHMSTCESTWYREKAPLIMEKTFFTRNFTVHNCKI